MCKHKNNNYTMSQCFMIQSLKHLDRNLNQPIIDLNENAKLVENLSYHMNHNEKKISKSFVGSNIQFSKNLTWQDWATEVIDRLRGVFRTHVLHLNLLPKGNEDKTTSRHRRRHQMLPMMLLGVVSVATVIIPMGFQFLAVIAGKSFLMAKMALILASVNGLKRVASSGVHYGLYHTDGYHGGYHHAPPPPASHFASQYWYDRDGQSRME
uniref:CSON002766 protein n=1 Tax=Culicoides sonorensis TaxID=179676 RepID=A0A336MJV4_CULSO